MNEPLVSVITPFKDTHAFLDEMIDSVIMQTHLNWELIIVDDHSTDDSFELVESKSLNDSRIRLISNRGKGIISALQSGYIYARGIFITRMDSDDIMHPNKLASMVTQLQKSGRGYIALGKVKYFSAQILGAGFERYEQWLNDLTDRGDNFSNLYKECVIPSPCWMVYKLDFDQCGGFNSSTYPEDYDLAFRFFQNGLKCIPATETLHYWRDYAHRASRVDPNYADNTFISLKLTYFLKLHRDIDRPLVVWGAGRKGKSVSKALIDRGICFHWVCDNPKKIGKKIYGQPVCSFLDIDQMESPQHIITVANYDAQIEINVFFKSRWREAMIDFFFFC